MTTKASPLMDLLKLAEGEGDTEVLALRVYTAVYNLVAACRECERLDSIFPCQPEAIPDPVAYHAQMVAASERRRAALAAFEEK